MKKIIEGRVRELQDQRDDLMAPALCDALYWQRETLLSCTMLITEPNNLVAEVHDRMPVLLTPDKLEAWVEGDDKALLKPAPKGLLKRRAVSKRVNSSKADKRRCHADRGREIITVRGRT